ncbi:hypothetical protein B7494_g5654 [Chlorociboria aeruginascens]|nr:hypothetical protein B7494_g5654 [Chlorociboria aeruginascens]
MSSSSSSLLTLTPHPHSSPLTPHPHLHLHLHLHLQASFPYGRAPPLLATAHVRIRKNTRDGNRLEDHAQGPPPRRVGLNLRTSRRLLDSGMWALTQALRRDETFAFAKTRQAGDAPFSRWLGCPSGFAHIEQVPTLPAWKENILSATTVRDRRQSPHTTAGDPFKLLQSSNSMRLNSVRRRMERPKKRPRVGPSGNSANDTGRPIPPSHRPYTPTAVWGPALHTLALSIFRVVGVLRLIMAAPDNVSKEIHVPASCRPGGHRKEWPDTIRNACALYLRIAWSPFSPASAASSLKELFHDYQTVRFRGFLTAELETLECMGGLDTMKMAAGPTTNPIDPRESHFLDFKAAPDKSYFNFPLVHRRTKMTNIRMWDALLSGGYGQIPKSRLPAEDAEDIYYSFHQRDLLARTHPASVGLVKMRTGIVDKSTSPRFGVTTISNKGEEIVVTLGIEYIQLLLRKDLTDAERQPPCLYDYVAQISVDEVVYDSSTMADSRISLAALDNTWTAEPSGFPSPQRRKRRKLDAGSGSDPEKRRPDEDDKSKQPAKQENPPILSDYSSLPGPSLLKQTLGLQNRQHGQYLGLTGEHDTKLINLSPFNSRGEYESGFGTLRRVSIQSHFLLKSESREDVDDELADMDLVESIVKPHGQSLVDLYFRIIHPSFPIMHKKVFLEKYNRSYREFTPPVLAAVYILASNWWSYSPDLVNIPKPDIQKLENLVPKMMSYLLNRPKLSTVQAGLLLLQRPDGDSWGLTGQMMALAHNLGLHLDCSKWKIPEWERGLRKKLAWALFMQDKWGALVHGRPSFIVRDNWAVKPVESKDFPETTIDDDHEEGSLEIEKGKLLFIHRISLTEILADILDTFFTLRATMDLENEGENATIITLEKARTIQLRLKEWYANLPVSLALGETRARKLSSTGCLHLSYFAAEVTLHRAIIRFDSLGLDEHLRTITRCAAKMRFISAVQLVNKLEPAHLQSFWYFSAKINLAIIATFGSVLWATATNAEESEFYRSQLAEYRWTLRVSSKAAEFMKFTVGMLDASPVFAKTMNPLPVVPKSVPIGEEKKIESSQDGSDVQPATQSDPLLLELISNITSPDTDNTIPSSYTPEFGTPGQHFSHLSRPTWEDYAEAVNFAIGDTQDWPLDHLYDSEGVQTIREVMGSQPLIEQYDGSNFSTLY